ncbi:hypothetical protein V8F06_010504 [Rhypophila decipiens]
MYYCTSIFKLVHYASPKAPIWGSSMDWVTQQDGMPTGHKQSHQYYLSLTADGRVWGITAVRYHYGCIHFPTVPLVSSSHAWTLCKLPALMIWISFSLESSVMSLVLCLANMNLISTIGYRTIGTRHMNGRTKLRIGHVDWLVHRTVLCTTPRLCTYQTRCQCLLLTLPLHYRADPRYTKRTWHYKHACRCAAGFELKKTEHLALAKAKRVPLGIYLRIRR